MEYDKNDYIVFEANPNPDTDEIWHTHIYSIKDKKIIKSFDYRTVSYTHLQTPLNGSEIKFTMNVLE